MACHHPKPAYLSTEGKVTFVRHEKALGKAGFMHIRCGMCNGCKFDHARDWAIRCYHESKLHQQACFVNPTYAPEFLPPHGTLDKRDLQLFLHRFRKAVTPAKIRYFAAGEYGTKKGRPHYHLVIFGWEPSERKLIGMTEKGNPIYQDELLQKCWGKGRITWSDFDAAAARYVAHYTADKLKSYAVDKIDPETGLRPYEVLDESSGQIWKLTPEFQLQSLKPGIGIDWLKQYWHEVFPADSVVMNGKQYPPPRAYYKWLKENQPEVFDTVKRSRQAKSLEMPYESGLRQWQKTQCKELKLQKFKRPTHDKGNRAL